MIDIRQSPQWANYQKSLGWKVERIKGVNYAIRKIPVLGNIVKIQRPKQLSSLTVRRLDRKYRSFQVIVEPLLMANCQWLMATSKVKIHIYPQKQSTST